MLKSFVYFSFPSQVTMVDRYIELQVPSKKEEWYVEIYNNWRFNVISPSGNVAACFFYQSLAIEYCLFKNSNKDQYVKS